MIQQHWQYFGILYSEYPECLEVLYCGYCMYSEFCAAHNPSTRCIWAFSTDHTPRTRSILAAGAGSPILSILILGGRNLLDTQSVSGLLLLKVAVLHVVSASIVGILPVLQVQVFRYPVLLMF